MNKMHGINGQLVGENGELLVSRKSRMEKVNSSYEETQHNSRFEKRQAERLKEKKESLFDLRNSLNVNERLKTIKENFVEFVQKVRENLKFSTKIKSLLITGIFTVLLHGAFVVDASACVKEYTYSVKPTDSIYKIAATHGLEVENVKQGNNLNSDSLNGVTTLLLPQVEEMFATANLNIREKASTESKVIGGFKKGDAVFVSHDHQNGWYTILHKGKLGYVSSSYVAKNTTTNPTPPNPKEVGGVKEVKYVNTSSLRVREQPTINSAILGSYQRGDEVEVIGKINGWAKISFKGKAAYISGEYLSDKKPEIVNIPPVEVVKETKYVNTSSLRVRTQPSTNSTILGSLTKGAKVEVLGKTNGWARISFNGKTAYVSEGYLSNKAPEEAKVEEYQKYLGTFVSVKDSNHVIFTINGKNEILKTIETVDPKKFVKGANWDLAVDNSTGTMVLVVGEPLHNNHQ